jgi:hypothetical protein
MMKRMLVVFATLFLAASALHAQSVPMQATIPFDFVVGNSTMTAGTYSIVPTRDGGSALLLRNTEAKSAVMALPLGNASDVNQHGSELVFKVVNGHYYLWQIWTAGYSEGREFSVKALKTEIAQAGPIQTVSIKTTHPKA